MAGILFLRLAQIRDMNSSITYPEVCGNVAASAQAFIKTFIVQRERESEKL